jgi:SAM-dependent methyltransferase
LNYDSLAALYERQYANYRDDLAFYARLAERLGVSRVLELGAGSGRVSIALARRGLQVTGLEFSQKMLENGFHNAAREGVQVDFVHGDARDFKLNQQFPLVIAPFNALMHLYSLSDQDKALRCLKAHLEPGGVFAFDVYIPRFGSQGVLRHEGETFLDPDGTRTDVFLTQRLEDTAQIVTTTYYVDTVAPDASLTRTVLELTQRYFTRFELLRWLADFRVTIHGDFEAGRLSDSSRHYVVVATLDSERDSR